MPPAPRYEVYNQFAWFYSRGWGVDFHKSARPVFEDHVFPRLPAGAFVLDLCCGSGDLTRTLCERGYQVTGIDGSREMLSYARRQAPEAEFRQDDARTFSVSRRFDAVLSTFDSLNHILTVEELDCVFLNVFRSLVPGGLFVFDLNMQEAFETLWRGHFASVEDEAVGITRGSYDAEARTGRADVTLFQLENGEWQRYDVTVLERCFAEQEVTEALGRSGFADLEMHDAWELGLRGEVALGRQWFFARRPHAAR